MPEKSPDTYTAITYLWVFSLAMLGGLVAYMKEIMNGKKWKFKKFIAEITASAFVGVLTFYVCESMSIPQVASAAVVGVAGHSSSKFLLVLEDMTTELLRRFRK